jgi:hypothetical protein
MADTLIDITEKGKPRRYQINRCHYCNHDKYPHGKPIDPTTDQYAKKMEDGSWKCGICVGEDVKKSLSLFGGSSK